ncbi:MAG: AAA family ATPase [Clostridia bacterium]|jgi:Predicted ATPase|uniref:AAA family ATPase n=1 Tax=Pumilibacter muris TaxID=2941510 RepID=UPI00203AFEAE|nr:AAA family ATPase [Pumilibacter muris]MCX4363236.1 AAA family ATPase [Clostridia bacterium]
MVYLDKFIIPNAEQEEKTIKRRMAENGGVLGYIDNIYPCGLFTKKELSRIDFEPLTILYGGNGSGKSTLLNLIAQKLELNRIAPFNSSEVFDIYRDVCTYEMGNDDEGFKLRVPNGSRIITSDDVFDYMLTVRTNNSEIHEHIEQVRDNDYGELKFGETVRLHGMEDYEQLRLQVLSRRKSVSRRQFIRKTVGEEVKLNSNGETALRYFEEKLKNDTLYCLDEPENSLSPKLQLQLVEIIRRMVRYCGCQMIIATHSPFILSIDGAKIYDLDSIPVALKKWWQLENVRIYYDFFSQYKNLFTKVTNATGDNT